MATQLQLRRGSSGDHSTFAGAQGEITVVTDDWSLRVHDGVTAGGHAISGGGGGASALSELTDVAVTGGSAPSDGQVLVYDQASGKWQPGSASGGGGAQVSRFLSSGTWVKPANLQFVRVFMVSPGGGGGAGTTGNGYNSPGGFGGYGGRIAEAFFAANELPETVSVGVGAAGAGGVYGVNNGRGGAGGSCSFGNLLSTPTGLPSAPWNGYVGTPADEDTRVDEWFEVLTYGGSGAANYYGFLPPGAPVAGQYDSLTNIQAQNNPVAPGAGGGGASVINQWYNGTLTNISGWNYTPAGPGAEGFAISKPVLDNQTPKVNRSWDQYGFRGRAAAGAIGTDVSSTLIAGGSYEGYLASTGGAGAYTDQELAALQRAWWGCGGGGGGISYNNTSLQVEVGPGGNGGFPGGGGGGSASNASGVTPANGGNGGGGIVLVYSFIGSSSFSYV